MTSSTRRYWDRFAAFLRRDRIACAIVIGATVLRALGLGWGLPWNPAQYNFHPDEWTYTMGLYAFPFHLVFQTFHPYPPLLPYLLNLASPCNIFAAAVGNAVHFLATGKTTAVVSELWIYAKLIGRSAVVGLGGASCAVLYALALRLYGRAAAIGAALFMGLALYPVQNASFFVPGVPAAFGVACTLYLAECLRRDPSRRRYLFAAVSLATATSLWYPAGVVALALCIAHIDGVVATTPPGRARRRALIDHRVRLAIGVTALLLIVFFPPLLIHPGEILAKIANEFFQAGRAAPSDRWAWTSWLALGLKHVELLSPGLVLLAGIAIAWNVCAWRRRELLWWLPVLCCWLLLVNLLRTRHLLVLVPFYALWVGRWLQAIASARLRSLRVVGYGGCAVVAVLAFGTNLRIFWMRYHDTRTEAAAWIAAQIPAGATLGMKCMEGGRKAYDHAHFDEFMWDFPRIDPRRYRLTDCLDRPEYLVLSEFTNKEVITAYTSGLMQGDAWPADEYGLWWRQKIPPPPLMALYRALLFGEGDGYVLVRYFPGAGIEARNFDLSYRLTRLKVVDWRLIGRIFANPWRFLALEYPAPEIRIYRQRGAAAS